MTMHKMQRIIDVIQSQDLWVLGGKYFKLPDVNHNEVHIMVFSVPVGGGYTYDNKFTIVALDDSEDDDWNIVLESGVVLERLAFSEAFRTQVAHYIVYRSHPYPSFVSEVQLEAYKKQDAQLQYDDALRYWFPAPRSRVLCGPVTCD